MSDDERPRDRYQDRGGHRGPRESRGGDRERGGTPSDRRQRSRSPRRERGGRRSNRYRSRSRDRDNTNDHRGRGRSDRDHDRDERDDRSRRDPPRGPRGGAAPPSGPRRPDFSSRGSGPVKPPTGPRGSAEVARKEEVPDVEMRDSAQKPDDMDDETWEMKKTMGFTGFRSTKNVKVPGNDKNYGVRKDKKLEARQYMNRQGGFNRPLSPSRT